MRLLSLPRLLGTLSLIAIPAASHAQFTSYTTLASFLAATTNVGTDAFENLSITGLTPSPLNRTAGAFNYVASVPSSNNFFGAGSIADKWLSTSRATDAMLFNGFAPGVRGVGGLIFGSDFAGAFLAGTSIRIDATRVGGAAFFTTLNNTTTSAFFGLVATSDITSFTVTSVQPQTGFAWGTVNNFVLANGPATNVVPEPSTYLLMGTGLVGLVGVACRRRANV